VIRAVRAVLTLVSGLLLGACGETSRRAVPPERGLHDPVIQTRLEAVREVGRTRDLRFVPDLIDLLDDEDPSVRLFAGATLRQATGHDTGYRAHAGPEERLRHVEAWRAWWRSRPEAGATR
jgi:HEAT repeat protein